MSLRLKILAPIAGLAMLFVLASGLLFADLRRLDRQVEQTADLGSRLNFLSLRLGQVEEWQKTDLLSFAMSRQSRHLETLTAGNAEAESLLSDLRAIMAEDAEGQRLLDQYARSRAALADQRDELIAAVRVGDPAVIDLAFRNWRRGAAEMDALRSDLLLHINARPRQLLESIARAQQRALTSFLLFSVLAALLLVAAMIYYRRLVTTPLRKLTSMAERIAAGDLQARLNPVNRQDELGTLGNAFNRMAASLQRAEAALIREVQEKTSELEERRRITGMLARANAELAETHRGLQMEVSQRQASERALAREKERAEVTLMSIGDGVIITDPHGRLESLNPVAEALTGWHMDDAQDRPIAEVFRIIDEETRLAPPEHPVHRCLREGRAVAGGERNMLVSRDGRELHVDDSTAPIRDVNGRIWGAVLVFHDVSESRKLARQIAYQARHDALTGLLNRREFESRLEHALRGATEQGAEHVLLYLDLDQFKVVNDTCGHMAGDELLRQLTAVLSEHVRNRDTFARLGGDEFGVLLEHCRPDRGLELAEELRRAVLDFRFRWQDRVFALGVSIGMVCLNVHSEGSERVLSRADAACYAAKEAGRNRVIVADSDDGTLRARQHQAQWVMRIREALEHDRLQLRYQPIVAATGDESGLHYEVLVSLIGEQGEMVPPLAFLPAAERFGLMTQLDSWVVDHTLQWLAAHPQHVSELALCTVNLSGASVGNDEFTRFLRERLDHYAIPPGKLCFEITETVAVSSLRRTREFMEAFRRHGCRFSLDDFGSGFSSYTYLKHLPVDYLKIDGAFVKDIADDAVDRAMVESINRLGHVLGKRTIAEFVETQVVFDRIRELGVDYVQGYAVARPQPLDSLVAVGGLH